MNKQNESCPNTTATESTGWLFGLMLLSTLASLGCRPELNDQAVVENNRGVGLMGQFQYTPAREVFAKLHEADPTDVDLITNLAIARLNEQGEANVTRAMELLDNGIEQQPDHARARYCRGLLRLYNGQPEEAVEDFAVANEQVPRDPDAAYLRGLCLEQSGKVREAGPYYERALELEPYYASALLGLSRVARQAGDADEAMKALDEFAKLKESPYARVFEFKYMAMGRLGEAWTIGEEPVVEATLSGNLFADVQSLPVGSLPAESGGAVTFADLDGDLDLDIVLCPPAAHCLVLMNDGSQTFSVASDHPLSQATGIAVLHGDLDNDGRVDQAVLGNAGVDLVFGGNADPPRSLGAELGEELGTRGGAMFDADHDGDLDIFCLRTVGSDLILNNNGDGSFRVLAEEHGLNSGTTGTKQVCVGDFDNDRDLDLLLLKEDGRLVLRENDRLWQYRSRELPEDLTHLKVHHCLTGDFNQDGWQDLLTLSAQDGNRQLVVWHGQPDWQFQRAHTLDLPKSSDRDSSPSLAFGDANGDGLPEIFHTAGATSIEVLDHKLKPLHQIEVPAETLMGWGLASLSADRGPSVVASQPSGLLVAGPGSARHDFVTVSFGGKLDVGDSLRSNLSGIGTRWRAHAGRFATSGVTLPSTIGPGQSLQPTPIGLGGKPQLDMLEMVWPDGVFQSELALKAGKTRKITETQRQLSSCPVLFAWDGRSYAFVTDLIGVGGLGYLVTPGVYGTPRPFERLLLSSDQLVQRGGRLALKLGEPMEEACYLDHVALQRVDLPQGWSAALDERAGVNPPLPTSELFFYRRDATRSPNAAINDRGDDMLAAIQSRDGVAAEVGTVDPRFIGMLEREHQLTVRFSQPINDDARTPVLLIDGWIEYPYSQTNFAAWQAGLEHEEPTIEARGPNGSWVTLLDKFGYPAGMPRSMSVPLANLPPDTTELRIRTNLEIYWDRIRIVYSEPCPEASVIDLPLVGASLARVGFAKRTTGPQRRPLYDYAQRTPTWDTRHPLGNYTRFGDVIELLATRDDAVAIFGPGEEVHFEFESPAMEPTPSETRLFVLAAAGWCKDMDMYTATGGTLEPLPRSSNEDVTDRDRLHSEYNTRLEAGR